ncbi:hypothetical protein ACOQFV_24505 [Nocardiopsis changdeensis]|uniref:Uncharacterized protein n=1 Tax=Nocardiopsis changdeensis TaxID=2831969 RepID=A0A975KTZ0_9ACTN|nr:MULTISPECIES: hypothetical protein [Nocardiopsis]QUX26447.1 hypothetical protein KGD84_32635 [Nocardiopsis changdeensis]QYX40719.1 hypothetical protein K1J57_32485 [Nocardiopsis sp. MT53]
MAVKPGESVKYTVLEFLPEPYPPIGTRLSFADYDAAVREAINTSYCLDTEIYVYAGHYRGEQEPQAEPLAQTCACPRDPESWHLLQEGCGYPARGTA